MCICSSFRGIQQGDFRFLLLAAVAQRLLLHVKYHCRLIWFGTSVINCRPESLYQLAKTVNLTMHGSMFAAKSIMEVHFELRSLKCSTRRELERCISDLHWFISIQFKIFNLVILIQQCQYLQIFLIPGLMAFFFLVKMSKSETYMTVKEFMVFLIKLICCYTTTSFI